MDRRFAVGNLEGKTITRVKSQVLYDVYKEGRPIDYKFVWLWLNDGTVVRFVGGDHGNDNPWVTVSAL